MMANDQCSAGNDNVGVLRGDARMAEGYYARDLVGEFVHADSDSLLGDPEFHAMRECMKLLSELGYDAQQRVLTWLGSRLHEDTRRPR